MAVTGKGELAERIAAKAGVSVAEATRVLNAAVDSVSEALEAGHEVRITGFGTFKVAETRERTGRHPRTGEPLKIPAGHRISFGASPKLTESVRPAA